MTNFVLCIHVQIRFASTEKNYSHRLACILFNMDLKGCFRSIFLLQKGSEFQHLIAVKKKDFNPELLTLGILHERLVTDLV